jgi:hypothetical protein
MTGEREQQPAPSAPARARLLAAAGSPREEEAITAAAPAGRTIHGSFISFRQVNAQFLSSRDAPLRPGLALSASSISAMRGI